MSPKNRSRLFDRAQLLSPVNGTFEGNLEESTQAIFYNIPIHLDGISWTGGATAITTETTVMTGSFVMDEWQARAATIEFSLGMVVTTDAAPGTFTFRVKDENSGNTIVSMANAESANASSQAVIYQGGVGIAGNEVLATAQVGGWISRNNQSNLFAANGIAAVSVADVFSHFPSDAFFVAVTVQSSDAGTQIDRMQGYIRVTFLDPNRLNVLTI